MVGANKPVIATDYRNKFKLAGVSTHHEPELCYFIQLPDGSFEYYPVSRCKVVTAAKALEAAIASGEYDDVPVEQLRVIFGAVNMQDILKDAALE